MSNGFSTILLQRTIGQVRYRPTLSSFEAVSEAAKLLEKKFDEWIAPKPDVITLYTPKDKKYIEITSDAVTYVKEGVKDVDDLKQSIETIFKKNTKDLGVAEIRRIGFRKTQVLKTKFSYSDLVDLNYKKFYPITAEIKKISGEKIRDVAYVLDSVNENILNHVMIGPLKKTEIGKYFKSVFNDNQANQIEIKDDQNLFIDVDVFLEEGLDSKNTLEKFERVIKENERILSGYIDYLFS